MCKARKSEHEHCRSRTICDQFYSRFAILSSTFVLLASIFKLIASSSMCKARKCRNMVGVLYYLSAKFSIVIYLGELDVGEIVDLCSSSQLPNTSMTRSLSLGDWKRTSSHPTRREGDLRSCICDARRPRWLWWLRSKLKLRRKPKPMPKLMPKRSKTYLMESTTRRPLKVHSWSSHSIAS